MLHCYKSLFFPVLGPSFSILLRVNISTKQINVKIKVTDCDTRKLITPYHKSVTSTLKNRIKNVENISDATEVFVNPPPDGSSLVMVQITRTRRTRLADD